MIPWLDSKGYYRRRWGQPVGRVGVDGGFSCPNRGRDRSRPGCAFCSESGNRPPYQNGSLDLAEQIRRGKDFARDRYGFQRFSLYFQAYSSTWASPQDLARIYDLGLSLGPFVDLTVGTRPDCLPDEVADLLKTYQTPDREVWVELGLQSCHDQTLRRINRGHDSQAFRRSAFRLRERQIPFTAHVMFGLPGEGKKEFLESVDFALAEGAQGLKLHDLLLIPGTPLHRDWLDGRLQAVEPELYLDAVAQALSSLPEDIVVWRVCSDQEDRTQPNAKRAPSRKNRFLNALSHEVLKRRGG